MPGSDSNQYDPVSDEDLGEFENPVICTDSEFKIGIQFQAKLVGAMDVAKPGSRREIIAAMRVIRYEFKAFAVKKQRVLVEVSSAGISVYLRKRKTTLKWWRERHSVLFQHPIKRVYYVSHDSHDLKIFSYISKRASNDSFMCVVFKAYKKSDAMRIVSTVGHAFDICHGRISDSDDDISEKPPKPKTASKEKVDDPMDCEDVSESGENNKSVNSFLLESEASVASPSRQQQLCINEKPISLLEAEINKSNEVSVAKAAEEPDDPGIQQSQLDLLKQKLAIENSARLKAEAKVNHMAVHNRELVGYLHYLIYRIERLEASSKSTRKEDSKPEWEYSTNAFLSSNINTPYQMGDHVFKGSFEKWPLSNNSQTEIGQRKHITFDEIPKAPSEFDPWPSFNEIEDIDFNMALDDFFQQRHCYHSNLKHKSSSVDANVFLLSREIHDAENNVIPFQNGMVESKTESSFTDWDPFDEI